MRTFLRTNSPRGSRGMWIHVIVMSFALAGVLVTMNARPALAQCEWTAGDADAICDGDGGSGGDVLVANFDDFINLIDNTLMLVNDSDGQNVGFDGAIDAGTDAGGGDELVAGGDNLTSIDGFELSNTLGFERLRKQGASTWNVDGTDNSMVQIFIEAGQVNFGSAVSPATFSNATSMSVSAGGEADGYLTIDDGSTLATSLSVDAGGELEALVMLGGGLDQLTNYGQVSGPSIDFGAGDDIILNYSAWDAVTNGGAGDDQVTNNGTISGAGVDPEWDLSGGNDVFSNYGTVEADVEIDMGADQDTLNLYDGAVLGSVRLDAAGEYDLLNIGSNGILSGSVDLGAGANGLIVNGLVGTTGSVSAGGGADDLLIGSTGTVQGQVDLGDGDNSIQVDGTLSATGDLLLGSGNDSLELGSTGRLYAATDLGAGSDSFEVVSGGLVNAIVNMGADADLIRIFGRIESGGAINGEEGNDTLFLEETAEISTGGNINLGPDSDQATVRGDIAGTLSLGEGVDTATWDSATSSVTGQFLGGEQGNVAVDSNLEVDLVTLEGTGGVLVDLNLTGGVLDQWEHVTVSEGDWQLDNGGVADDDMVTFTIDGGSFDIPVNDLLSPATVNLNGGTLTVDGALELDNPLNMDGGAIEGTGTITGDIDADGGTITPAEAGTTGELTVDGDLNLGEDVVLLMDVNPVTGEADMLEVTGDLVIDDATLRIDGPSGGQEDLDFDLLHAGTLTGEFTIDDTATLDYVLTNDPITGTVSIKVNPNYETAGGDDGENTENQDDTRQGIADAVDAGTIDEELLDALDDVESDVYLKTLDQLHGEPYILNSVAVIMANNLFSHQLLHRLGDRERCGTLSGGQEDSCRAAGDGDTDLWIDFVLERMDYDHPDASMRANIDLNQVYLGLDTHTRLSTFGVAGAYSQNMSKTDLNAQIEGQVFNLGFYGSQDLGLFNLDGALIYGVSRQQTQRSIDIQGTLGAQDRFTEIVVGGSTRQTILVDAAATQEYRSRSGIEIQPKLGLTASHSLAGRIAETAQDGTDCGACLEVNLDPYTRMTTNMGAEARVPIELGRTFSILPEIRGSWEHTLVGRRAGQKNAFANGTNVAWSIDGYMPDNLWSAGIGLNVELGQDWIGYADFDRTKLATGKDDRYSFGIRKSF